MNHKKHHVILLLIGIITCSLHVNCASTIQYPDNRIENVDEYLEAVENLNKDFFKNYWEIEKRTVQKLDESGIEYFTKNNCYQILGRFESTLTIYCQICEKLNVNNKGGLLTSYLHLNDTGNVRIQYERMQGDQYAFIYKEFHKYEDSGKRLESDYISIKFDKRDEEFANTLFTHVNAIEKFITQEWDGLLPPKIRIVLLYSDGPSPYNALLNESYLTVKSVPLYDSKSIAGAIVHETFHLVNSNQLSQKGKFVIDRSTNSFKVLDEGYAQLIQDKFMTRFVENREKTDQYSKYMVQTNSFNFKNLKTNWAELFSSQEINIYSLAYSFVYFLEDTYGQEKLKALFLPTTNISENTWIEYVESYFGKNMNALIKEWKQKLVS